MAELLVRSLRRLRDERGLSRSQLSRATVRPGFDGVPEATIEALETKPGRLPKADTLEALAAALGVRPESFYEWPIAAAQRGKGRPRADPVDAALADAVAASAAPRRRRGSGST